MSIPLQVASSNALAKQSAFLQANSEAYECLVARIQVMDLLKEAEAVLGQVALAARFASKFHPGRFADGAIETPALEIGAALGDLVVEDGGFVLPVARKENRRRVLHVATTAVGIGGHTRMLCHWIRNDQSSFHSVALVNQDVPVPLSLSKVVQNGGGDLLVFPRESHLCQKAKWLREAARRSADWWCYIMPDPMWCRP